MTHDRAMCQGQGCVYCVRQGVCCVGNIHGPVSHARHTTVCNSTLESEIVASDALTPILAMNGWLRICTTFSRGKTKL